MLVRMVQEEKFYTMLPIGIPNWLGEIDRREKLTCNPHAGTYSSRKKVDTMLRLTDWERPTEIYYWDRSLVAAKRLSKEHFGQVASLL